MPQSQNSKKMTTSGNEGNTDHIYKPRKKSTEKRQRTNQKSLLHHNMYGIAVFVEMHHPIEKK